MGPRAPQLSEVWGEFPQQDRFLILLATSAYTVCGLWMHRRIGITFIKHLIIAALATILTNYRGDATISIMVFYYCNIDATHYYL